MARKKLRYDDFALRLVNMKQEAAKLALYRTMHKIDEATKEMGFERADQLQGKQIRGCD